MRALALALLLPLAACGSDDDSAADGPAADAPAETAAPEASGDAGTAETTDAEPTGPNEAELEADAEADALAQMEADGVEDITELRDLIVGDWSILIGPAESVSFEASETRGAGEVSFYMNDRLMDSGRWSVDGDALTVTGAGINGTYTLAESDLESLTFTGGMGAVADEATMILER